MKTLALFSRAKFIISGIGFALALLATVAPAYADAAMAIDVNIALSEKAEAKLKATGEGITVLASFSGAPKSDAEQHANDIGMIDLGSETIELSGVPGPAYITGENVNAERLKWVDGPVNVNVNVFSSRKSSADNILNCDFVDAEIEQAAKAPITLNCSLIDEGLEVNVYP